MAAVAEEEPLCVLVLPDVLERLPFAARGRDLLRAPRVLAVEPPRWRPVRLAEAVASMQARRVARRLPGVPRVVVLLEGEQYPLARALLAAGPRAELWYAGSGGGALHELAVQRAALMFDAAPRAGRAPFEDNAPLWDRLEELGIAQR